MLGSVLMLVIEIVRLQCFQNGTILQFLKQRGRCRSNPKSAFIIDKGEGQFLLCCTSFHIITF